MAFKGITAFILNNGEGGGGGEPSGNYNDLTNHPQVNGNELIGNKTAEQLGLLSADTDIPTKLSDLDEDTTHRTVTDSEKQSWNNKVDSVAGKGLSTNDYTYEDQEDVAKIDGLVGTVSSLSSSVGIVSGKVRTLEEEMLSVEYTMDGVTTALDALETTVEAIPDQIETVVKDTVGWVGKNYNKSDASHVFVKSTARTFAFQLSIPIINGHKYKLVADVSAISGFTGTNALAIKLAKNGIDISNSYSIQTTAQGQQVIEMTATDSADSGPYVYCFILSSEDDNATITLSNVMVVDESVTDYSYEPHHESVQEMFDSLGTASTKNSTSVVTESTDLVESGAVYDALGFGNKNLLNPDVIKNTPLQYVPVYVGDGDYTLSSTCPQTGSALACIFLLAGSVRTGASTSNNGVWNGQTRTVTAVNGYITVASRLEDGVNPKLYNTQLEKGSTATSYEPYHASVEETIPQVVSDAVGWDVNELYDIDNVEIGTAWNGASNPDRARCVIPIVGGNTYVFRMNGTNTLDGVLYISSPTIIPSVPLITNFPQKIPTASTDNYIVLAFSKTNITKADVDKLKLSLKHLTVDETKADNSIIATTENNSTASQDYAVGDYFIKNTILGKTKIAIARGGTFTKDMNYEETDVAKEITELYKYIGILTTPISAVVANNLQPRFKDITSDFYLGTLRAEIAAGDFSNIRVGDYIIGQTTGSKYYVACLDWMFNKGDQTNATYQAQAYGQHHLGLMLFKPVGTTSLWLGKGDAGGSWQVSANDKGRCPWNAATDVDPTSTSAVGSNDTNITRSYNGSNVSGYMGSFIRERMDAILLPQCFQADFGSSNVLMFRNLNGNAVITDKPSGGQGNWNGCTSGWDWYDRYLDLPSEVEIYGSRIFGSAYDIGVQCERLPMFKNADINTYFPRLDLWTKAVASSSFVANRSNRGGAGNNVASYAFWACPLACVR